MFSSGSPVRLGDVVDDDREVVGVHPDRAEGLGDGLDQRLLLLHGSAFPHVDVNYGHLSHLTVLVTLGGI